MGQLKAQQVWMLRVLPALLVGSVVAEVLFLRILARVGIYIFKEGTPAWIGGLYNGLVFLGTVMFNFAAVLAPLMLLAIAYLLWRRRRGDVRVVAILIVLAVLMEVLLFLVSPSPVLSLGYLALSTALLGAVALMAWMTIPSRRAALLVAVVALSYVCTYYFKAAPFLQQLHVQPSLKGLTAFASGEVLLLAAALFLPWIFGLPRQWKSLAAPTLLALLLVGMYVGKPDMVPLIITWAFGVTLLLPFFVYVIALWLGTWGILRVWQRACPLAAWGLLLLFLGHRMLPITYFNDLALVGLLLFVLGVADTMVSPSKVADFEPGVTDRLGTVRCLTQAALVYLVEAVQQLFEIFRSQWRITSSEARLQAPQAVTNRIPDATWLFDAYETSEDFISEDKLISSWIKSP